MLGGVRWKLWVMMFLQYAIWGAWAPVLTDYLQKNLGFSGGEVGTLYLLLPLACMIAPFVGGQIADRWAPTQWFLAVVHLAAGLIFLILASQASYGYILGLMAIISLLYAPTVALTNSLSFHHLKDIEREFGAIRVGGTIGWIVAGLLLSAWRWAVAAKWLPEARFIDCIFLAGMIAVVMGLFCLILPHTPPAREGKSPWAFIEAVQLFRNKNFAIFMVISFIVATELQFYYLLTAPFLADIGVASKNLSATMTLAQIAEIVAMAVLLPWLLPKWGARRALALGVIAWPVRYVIFAIGTPLWLVIASLTLHGICYVFFFVVGMIYVDTVAPKEIRASAQSLFAVVALGLGMAIGAKFAGWLQDVFSQFDAAGKMIPGSTDWTWVFLVPCFLTVACALAFLLFFRPEREAAEAEPASVTQTEGAEEPALGEEGPKQELG